MNTGFCRTQHFLSEHPTVTDCIPQLVFSFYRHRPIHADFSGVRCASAGHDISDTAALVALIIVHMTCDNDESSPHMLLPCFEQSGECLLGWPGRVAAAQRAIVV